MSDKATGDKPGRRSTVVLIGGLAAGAALGVALGTNAVTGEQDSSISEQFRTAFTPGAQPVEALSGPIVVTVT